ncbi:MAG: GTP-binding protein, partial [Candidatus Eisenbacteria bacterium]
MSRIPPSRTRNFCIIAHIDHGKSTLADRLLEITGTVSGKDMKAQVLDAMDLEREKGITIKSHPIAMEYVARDGLEYALNLIDTPGHVDFTYEVSRSLAACEGAVLLVDASQGVEAQTLSNFYLAVENGLTIVPALNKIDMPAARPDEVGLELAHLTDVEVKDIPRVSAKAGIGVQDLLETVIARVPPPRPGSGGPLQALIFDSQFDTYLGVVVYVRVVEGRVKPGDMIQFASNGKKFEVGEVGQFKLRRVATSSLEAGQVGYIVAGVRDVLDARVGDTVNAGEVVNPTQLPGYREVKPMVFSGLYPIDAVQYEDLKEALGKLKLNDAALIYEPETSVAL